MHTAHEEARGHLRTSPALPPTVALAALWLMEMSGATCSLAGRNESEVTSSAVLPDSSLGSHDCPGLLAVSPQETAGPVPQGCGRRKERQGQGGCFHKVPLFPRDAPLQGPTQARSSGFPGLAPGEQDSCGATRPPLLMPFASPATPSVL